MKKEPTTITLRTSNGRNFLTAEEGGGREVMANRTETGPWEQWRVHAEDDGRYSLQAHDGRYLTAEIDGPVAVRATESGEWERFEIEVRDVGVAFKSAHGTYLQAPGGGGFNDPVVCVGDDPTLPGEWEFFASSVAFWVPAEPDIPVCARPLVGPLAIRDKVFVDDTGYRRVLFCSWFPALRMMRDDHANYIDTLNKIAKAGYQGIRVFLAVGGWTDYWDGKEVVPVGFTKWFFTGNHMRTDQYGDYIEAWPDYDDLLRTLLRDCVARKLRLHVTTGDMQIICPGPDLQVELDLHTRCARICAEEGGLDVIAVAECTNEFPLNRYGSDGPESIEQMGRIIDIWREAIPGVLTMQGAIPQNEEPESLEKASTHGDVCAVHVTRSPEEMCLKRTMALVYWEGDYRAFPKPYWEGEPLGPGEDSYQRQDDPSILTAAYGMMAITGQASNQFSGPAVRNDDPLDSVWGFYELPKLLALIPEDIVTWDHGNNARGGIEYWWKGNDFITIVLDGWDPSSPRPVVSWTLYNGTSVQSSGTGTHARMLRKTSMYLPKGPSGARSGILVGKFA